MTGETSAFPNSKKALAEGRTILWADESGFYLLPALLRTPCRGTGQALGASGPDPSHPAEAELRPSECHQRSMTGDLYFAVQDHSYKSPDVIGFLEKLLAEIPGKLLVIWDGAPIHRSRAVKEYLGQGAAQRLQLEQLLGYAPELNPDEAVWRYLKRVELKNLVCADLEQSRRDFWTAAERLLAKSDVLRSCIREVGYVYWILHASVSPHPSERFCHPDGRHDTLSWSRLSFGIRW